MNIKNLINHIKYENIFNQCKIDGKINWKNVSEYKNLPFEFIDKYFHQLKKYNLENKQQFNSYLLKKYKSQINWFILASYQEISEDILDLYFNTFDKRIQLTIIKYQKISLNFLLKNIKIFKNTNFIKALDQNAYIDNEVKIKIKSLL